MDPTSSPPKRSSAPRRRRRLDAHAEARVVAEHAARCLVIRLSTRSKGRSASNCSDSCCGLIGRRSGSTPGVRERTAGTGGKGRRDVAADVAGRVRTEQEGGNVKRTNQILGTTARGKNPPMGTRERETRVTVPLEIFWIGWTVEISVRVQDISSNGGRSFQRRPNDNRSTSSFPSRTGPPRPSDSAQVVHSQERPTAIRTRTTPSPLIRRGRSSRTTPPPSVSIPRIPVTVTSQTVIASTTVRKGSMWRRRRNLARESARIDEQRCDVDIPRICGDRNERNVVRLDLEGSCEWLLGPKWQGRRWKSRMVW